MRHCMERIDRRALSLMTPTCPLMRPKARAYSQQGHGPRADHTGRIHISDFRNPRTSSLAISSRSIHWVKLRSRGICAFCLLQPQKRHQRAQSANPFGAMCGRLSVGKGFLDALRFGWCGHVFDLLVRRAWPLAIMPFAEPGPDQNHALLGALAQLGFPGPRYLPLARYIASALPNLSCS